MRALERLPSIHETMPAATRATPAQVITEKTPDEVAAWVKRPPAADIEGLEVLPVGSRLAQPESMAKASGAQPRRIR
jgi:hypothetical protein